MLLSIANMNTEEDPDMESVRKAASEVREGEEPRGRKCEVALSDAVMVCDSPPGSDLLTSNTKHFEPLCAAVDGGRAVVDYRNPPTAG